MKVLSLFDGLGGARQALKEMDIDCEYYASEIDLYAIQIAKANHADINHIGDVRDIWFDYSDDGYPTEYVIEGEMTLNTRLNGRGTDYYLGGVNLLIGGFPCQSFSIAGNRKGFEDERGNLFFEALRILKEVKPKYFLFENVFSMSKENKAFIDEKLGVGHVMINSALLTAQNRKRIFWVGKLVNGKYEQVKIEQPEDLGVQLKDILQPLSYLPNCPIGVKVREKSKCLRVGGRSSPFDSKQEWDSPFQRISKKGEVKLGIEKASCLTGGAHSGGNHSDMDLIHSPFSTRRYSITECCRLQGFPEYYVGAVSKSQGYKALGNSFTVPVIKHILSSIITKL